MRSGRVHSAWLSTLSVCAPPFTALSPDDPVLPGFSLLSSSESFSTFPKPLSLGTPALLIILDFGVLA